MKAFIAACLIVLPSIAPATPIDAVDYATRVTMSLGQYREVTRDAAMICRVSMAAAEYSGRYLHGVVMRRGWTLQQELLLLSLCASFTNGYLLRVQEAR